MILFADTISIHAPPRGATPLYIYSYQYPHNFNSRPSARGDGGLNSPPPKKSISIHAPPRGATWLACLGLLASLISIHAPPRGATRRTSAAAKGRDISIHAPPRGATDLPYNHPIPYRFQFTPLREGRLTGMSVSITGALHFNSRPSARGDSCMMSATALPRRFQFTPLREGRRQCRGRDALLRQFQFTPLREGRRQKICNFCKSFVQPLQISMA